MKSQLKKFHTEFSCKLSEKIVTVPGFPLEIAGFLISLQNKRQPVRHNDHASLAVARGSTGTSLRPTHIAFFANVPIHGQSQRRLHACATQTEGFLKENIYLALCLYCFWHCSLLECYWTNSRVIQNVLNWHHGRRSKAYCFFCVRRVPL